MAGLPPRPSGCATRTIANTWLGSRAWSAVGRRPTLIISVSPSRGRWDARSATSSPFRYYEVHHRELHRHGDEASWWQSIKLDPLPIARRLWQRERLSGLTHINGDTHPQISTAAATEPHVGNATQKTRPAKVRTIHDVVSANRGQSSKRAPQHRSDHRGGQAKIAAKCRSGMD